MLPRELVIISGKGGTGKTSVTAALATCFTSKVLVDCDVDAANLSLLLQIKSSQITGFQSGHVAEIETAKCSGCGTCASVCRFNAITEARGTYTVREASCEGCKACVAACPEGAIRWKENSCGLWIESQTEQGVLFHATLYPGAENSGKLVTFIREKAKQHAIQNKIPWIIVDGPPGIGCPAIAAITGASDVLLVTEPTPAGYHDLERALQLVKHFRIPSYVLINRDGLNPEWTAQIETCAHNLGASVIGRLPYSPLWSEAQRKALPLPVASPGAPETQTIKNVADFFIFNKTTEIHL